MGVPGLWDILRPTGQVRSLTHLAVEDGFVANANGHRAYRIGIDTSIWFFHAQGGREGENPELRTLFFRCCRLMAMPFLPIFVFDGPKRPKIKRGKAVGGKEHWMVNNLRVVLDAFGFECRTAPGEAEAELAYLNHIGLIDAVLSDDVDCFLFGAHTVIRNSSATLSGNRAHSTRNADGKEDGQHVHIYRADEIRTHPAVGLSQGGLILIALLRGGDYDTHGIDGCGISTAHALARAGFGDSLLTAALSTTPGALNAFLPAWRAALRDELRTNASGFAPRKSPTLAKRIPDTFPAFDVLRCYTHPATSSASPRGLDDLWTKRPDIAKIAHVCEKFFEWGIEATIVKRFRNFLWPGVVLRTLLHAAVDTDADKRPAGVTRRVYQGYKALGSDPLRKGVETPSKALARTFRGMALEESEDEDDEPGVVTAIHGERRHASTDLLLEYRLEIRPRMLVAHARAGIQGLRTELADSAAAGGGDEDDGDDEDKKTSPPDPDSALRVWMPAVMVEYAHPRLVKAFKERQAEKVAKKVKRRTKARRGDEEADTGSESDKISPKPKAKVKAKAKASIPAKSKGDHSKASREDENTPAATIQARMSQMSQPSMDSASSIGTKAKSKSFLQLMNEADPFLASSSTPTSKPARPAKFELSAPRPFPLAIDRQSAKAEVNAMIARTRKYYSSTSTTLSDVGAHLKKTPRKSAEHISPRKPVRAPPSPFRARSLIDQTAKPMQMARSMTEDVTVISSDSDVPAPSLKLRPHNKGKKIGFGAKPNLGVAKPLTSSNLDLSIIDLT